MRLQERSHQELRCPFCHDEVQAEQARACPDCAAPHHPACYLTHGGCSACGLRPGPLPLPPQPRGDSPLRELLLTRRARATRASRRLAMSSLLSLVLSLGLMLLLPRSFAPYPTDLTVLLLTLLFLGAGTTVGLVGYALWQWLRASELTQHLLLLYESDARSEDLVDPTSQKDLP